MKEKILFQYGMEGGGGKVYQLEGTRVLWTHSEAALLDMLSEEDAKDIIIEDGNKEFDSWELFWNCFTQKYPNWKELNPEFPDKKF